VPGRVIYADQSEEKRNRKKRKKEKREKKKKEKKKKKTVMQMLSAKSTLDTPLCPTPKKINRGSLFIFEKLLVIRIHPLHSNKAVFPAPVGKPA